MLLARQVDRYAVTAGHLPGTKSEEGSSRRQHFPVAAAYPASVERSECHNYSGFVGRKLKGYWNCLVGPDHEEGNDAILAKEMFFMVSAIARDDLEGSGVLAGGGLLRGNLRGADGKGDGEMKEYFCHRASGTAPRQATPEEEETRSKEDWGVMKVIRSY